jgi:hypothetical protein
MSYHDVLNLVEVLGVLAFSGGTLRALFLGRRPLFWIENWPFAAAILALSPVSVLVLKQIRSRKNRTLLLVVTIFDALGLGLFSVLGVVITLHRGPHGIHHGLLQRGPAGHRRQQGADRVPEVAALRHVQLRRLRRVPAVPLARAARGRIHPDQRGRPVRGPDARGEVQHPPVAAGGQGGDARGCGWRTHQSESMRNPDPENAATNAWLPATCIAVAHDTNVPTSCGAAGVRTLYTRSSCTSESPTIA